MSQHDAIKSALLSKPDVMIVKEYSHRYELDKGEIGPITSQGNPVIVESIDFLVAPTRGTSSSSKLQDFMCEMIPGVTPILKKDFKKEVGLLNYGQLVYEEPVSKEEVVTDIDRQLVFVPMGSYSRRITITLYPNGTIARKSDSGIFPFPNRYLGNMGNIRLNQFLTVLRRKAT